MLHSIIEHPPRKQASILQGVCIIMSTPPPPKKKKKKKKQTKKKQLYVLCINVIQLHSVSEPKVIKSE